MVPALHLGTLMFLSLSLQGSDFGYPPSGPGPHPGQGPLRWPGAQRRRPAGPPRGGRPNMRNLDARVRKYLLLCQTILESTGLAVQFVSVLANLSLSVLLR